MRERHECHCMLFLTDDNAFVGEDTEITYNEVIEGSKGIFM
jgi:ferredoxin-thioredoxin reductase catalytic chain